MNIIKDLESKGWEIKSYENFGVHAKRKSTGKMAFFIDKNEKMNESELLRIWTKGYHPFTYSIENDTIRYYDILSSEEVRYP